MRLVARQTERNLFFVLILGLLIYAPILPIPLFFDDHGIFAQSPILDVLSPWSYWDFSSPDFKAWPLFYSLLWLVKATFGVHPVPLRLLLLAVHLSNTYLIYRLTGRFVSNEGPRQPVLPVTTAFVFAIHPLHVESLTSVLQLPNLLSMTFALLAFRSAQLPLSQAGSYRRLFLEFLLIVISVLLKPTGICFVLLWMAFRWEGLRLSPLVPGPGRKALLLLFALIVALGSYVVRKSFTGIEVRNNEVLYSHYYYANTSKLLRPGDPNLNYFRFPEAEVAESSVYGTAPQVMGLKLLLFSKNFYFYLTKSLVPVGLYPYYGKGNFDFCTVTLGFLFFLGLLFFPFLYKMGGGIKNEETRLISYAGLAIIAGFLPVSGIFYIPLMKASPTADHWYYWQATGYSVLYATLLTRLPKIPRTIFCLALAALTFYQVLNYRDLNAYLAKNRQAYPEIEFLRWSNELN